ncbi:MAG: zinc-ribbon domain containing protein [Clostridiales bacterium]|jgi:CxxC-x17-CxxC domain-containing protein|nr:zinc-ribbon domain containing protein [Clostridiales bacterium]MDR2713835.1 zinc-ribbon domain containing protein [Clostridiales bacterium]
MAFEDRTLTCKECGVEFLFSVSEQEFYAEKGFQNDPARCPECRSARKRQRSSMRGEREMFNVVCAECGVETQVPFQPTEDRPVYCRDCYQKQRENSY